MQEWVLSEELKINLTKEEEDCLDEFIDETLYFYELQVTKEGVALVRMEKVDLKGFEEENKKTEDGQRRI